MNKLPFAIAVIALMASCSKSDDDSSNTPPQATCNQAAGFTTSVDSINERIQFTDQSAGSVATYLWNFGDGIISSSKNPTHQFATAGVKSVSLTVNSADGKCSNQKVISVTVPIAAVPVEQKNRALFLDFSETWCPPCGAYGGPAFDSCLFLEDSKITMMKIYESSSPSSMNSPFASSFNSDYAIVGVPTFYVNSTPLAAAGGVYSSLSSNYNWVNNLATSFASTAVKAGMVMSKSIASNTMTVQAKVKFLSAQTAGKDYRLAVYVVEKNITASQQVTGQGVVTSYKHHNLLRACSSTTTYKGDKLNTGNVAISANQVYSKSFTINLQSSWVQANLKVIGVIWEVPTAGKPTLVNSVVLR